MKVAIVYVYPNLGDAYAAAARKFVASYVKFKPKDVEHLFFVVVNGGDFENISTALFKPLDPIYLRHDNSGFDIGAFQLAARCVDSDTCDLMVFCGSSTYIKHPRWLNRVVESFYIHGDTLYGAMGNRGVPANRIEPHIRTTGFWMTPGLFNKYPYAITESIQRYEFEHGSRGLTSWIIRDQGKTPWLVCGTGEFNQPLWDSVPNAYHNGDQSNLLFGDRLTMPPYYHVE